VTHTEIRYFFDLCKRQGIEYSFTVRELGQIRHVLAYRDMGLIADPLLFKLTLSEKHMWGAPPTLEGLSLLRAAILPADLPYRWMLFIEGGAANAVELFRHAVETGGHVRVGVGDTPLFDGSALTNAEQVGRIVEMARQVDRPVATPLETRRLLRQLPETGSTT
jgi:3-keto-5-aminohexanoate cleavage enzyme